MMLSDLCGSHVRPRSLVQLSAVRSSTGAVAVKAPAMVAAKEVAVLLYSPFGQGCRAMWARVREDTPRTVVLATCHCWAIVPCNQVQAEEAE